MFSSMEALRQEFGLDRSQTIEESIAELTRRRAAIHPDKMGGNFVSPAAEAHYMRLSEALEYSRNQNPTQLVLSQTVEIDGLTTLVKSLQNTVEQLRLDAPKQHQMKEDIKRELANSHRTLRISTATFATMCATILGFSEKLPSNPILAPIARSAWAKDCLLFLFLFSGIAFFLTWLNENRSRNIMQYLLSDRGLSTIMFWCLNSGHDEEPKTEITKQQIISHILEIGKSWHKSKPIRILKSWFRVRISHDFAEGIAASQLAIL
ncbi:hypothetical protein [Acidobacterium sp. S8]|uniref:hypothetical protein n=1 Tax=Acidobacterium sp. S8 TaxID=1641854 RepID=UPI00131EAA75|nr:hypothetical protein [Acidobacterium sp. S8]